MIKWIVLALAAYLLYRMFANDFLKKKKAEEKETSADMEHKIAAGEMVKDPECGTYVATDGSITVRDGETVHRFCSYECRDKFLKRLGQKGREIPARPRDGED